MSPTPASAPDDAGSTPDAAAARRRQVLLGGGLVASLLLGGVVLLTSGSPEDDLEAFVPAPRAAAADPAPAGPAVGAVALPPPASFRQGRNPFAVLYTAPAAAATTSGSTSAATAATAPAASAPTTTRATAPAAAPATGSTAPAKGTSGAGVRVWIEMDGGASGLDPAERARHAADGTWTFRVGAAAADPDVADHVVGPGEDFATYFRLLRLQYDAESARQCAQLQFGDSTLELCEADSITLG